MGFPHKVKHGFASNGLDFRSLQWRSLVHGAAIKHVRDRGLDHAVSREKHLQPVLNIKNCIKSEPSKSLPLSILNLTRNSLRIPFRPIDFIRQYPSIFEEFFPGGVGIHPHIRLTPEMLDLDAEEMHIYQSDGFKQDAADRLLKLLMISRVNKFPLGVIDRLRWDLGLPQDYVKCVVPEFPDYFRIVGGKKPVLELVCWINELGTSVMEKRATSTGDERGTGTEFRMHYSTGFEMDKKFKKWLDEWQKLPVISPYQNAALLPSKSDESDKWAVGILHELLHIFVTKKTERENVLYIGEHLGIRSMFKRALLNHPGIFYLSNKNGTYTVVLKEAFKRGVLTETNPLMSLRSKYIHLMHTGKEDNKQISAPIGTNQPSEMEMSADFSSDDENDVSGYDDELWLATRRRQLAEEEEQDKLGSEEPFIKGKNQKAKRKDKYCMQPAENTIT